MNVRNVTLDISKPTSVVHELRVGRGDRRGLTLRATIEDNGIMVDLSGMTATLQMRVGGTSVDLPCTVSGNTVTCEVDASMVGGGTDFAYIAIQDGDRAYSTERMRITVVDGNDS